MNAINVLKYAKSAAMLATLLMLVALNYAKNAFKHVMIASKHAENAFNNIVSIGHKK
ncbi:hypothetical protein HYX58_04300 [Candidatus Dependentiae bacterium]|nr:hypothetical protein [Candidatus Dependentiae bacterium]